MLVGDATHFLLAKASFDNISIVAVCYLHGLSLHQFAARAAEHISELNAIHCFLEGNGRTQRAILAGQAGHAVDLARGDPKAWNAASAKSFHAQDYRPMQRVIADALVGTPVARVGWATKHLAPCPLIR
jgi:fido (protein-threonine AMPylation protein)